MTAYLRKPTPVQAMRFLGASVPSSFLAFQAWLQTTLPGATAQIVGTENTTILIRGGGALITVFATQWVVVEDGSVTAMPVDEFEASFERVEPL